MERFIFFLQRVHLARDPEFLSTISYQPLLQTSPVSDLFAGFPAHAVGLLNDMSQRSDVTKAPNLPVFMRPFIEPDAAPLALQVPPDDIVAEEALECEELTE